jgi:hypothetical protein
VPVLVSVTALRPEALGVIAVLVLLPTARVRLGVGVSHVMLLAADAGRLERSEPLYRRDGDGLTIYRQYIDVKSSIPADIPGPARPDPGQHERQRDSSAQTVDIEATAARR